MLLVFELKKNDVLHVGGKKVEGDKQRSIEVEPGVYKVRLQTTNKKPVRLIDDDELYYPKDGRVVIIKELEVKAEMEGEVFDFNTLTVEDRQ